MVDVVTAEKRSQMMSGIKGRNTRPELVIRKGLHGLGFRYRLHDKNIPGKPDMVLPRYKAVIFIQGCFWHKHDCHLFKWPQTRQEFWRTKIEGNAQRDSLVQAKLHEQGWRTLYVWECAIKGKQKIEAGQLLDLIRKWLLSDSIHGVIRGTDTDGDC